MQEWRGLWLPDGETHLTGWMAQVNKIVDGKPTYQYSKLEAALQYVKQFRTALDIGAHCGLWAMHLTVFNKVHAFEPVAAHRECFEKNLVGKSNVHLHAMALGDRIDMVSIHTAPTSSGDSWVSGKGDIPMAPLDDLEIEDIDFVKVDCEGGELAVIKGGEKTIRTWRPTLIVEQKPGHGAHFGIGDTEAIPLLERWGAKVRKVMSGDYILSFE